MGEINSRNPIFVALDEIERHGDTFSVVPKGDMLHGFRCRDVVTEDVMVTGEMCGTIEPDEFLSRLYVKFRLDSQVGFGEVCGRVSRNLVGDYRQPIDCIALVPQPDGNYHLIGSFHNRVEFRHGNDWYGYDRDKIGAVELASYQPRYDVFCRVPVAVTDCTSEELVSFLAGLVRNK